MSNALFLDGQSQQDNQSQADSLSQDGLIQHLTKGLVERALQSEPAHRLGCDKRAPYSHGVNVGSRQTGAADRRIAITNPYESS